MKHGKRPTVAQRKLMEKWQLNWREWLVERDDHRRMVVISRDGVARLVIPKDGT